MRVTPAEVEEIMEVDSTTVPDMTPFIEIANSLVDEVCEPEGYTEARLKQIERWLSAHFVTVSDQRVLQERAGPVSQQFQNQVGLNLLGSRYGQTALNLDTKGGLAALSKQAEEGKRSNVGITWLGTE